MEMKISFMNHKPELLAPAGSFAALEAAIEGGADAVYFGASQFNARMRAGNFDDEEAERAIKLCRAYGIKSYITMNIRIFDRELTDALSLAKKLYLWGADALILADNGLAREIHRILPDFELHASTQLSGHTISDAEALQKAGFFRMVCPREISREELFHLCEGSPLEIEMFVHGAHCVSFSGQCLMSAVMGGRSGNRGSCAQPCRQPYTLDGKKGYPVSLKDMCLAGHIEDIIASGVASLKLEGRQKPPEYVYGVTKTYRRLLDEGRNANEAEIEYLKQLFSRQGFSDGYFAKNPRNMLGVRTLEEFNASEKTVFEGLKKKVPADVSIEAEVGKPLKYTMTSEHHSATVFGDIVNAADAVASMSEDDARACAAKLGNTPFVLRNFKICCDNNAFISRSMLNRLRRSAAEEIESGGKRTADNCIAEYRKPKAATSGKMVFTAEFAHPSQIPDSAKDFFEEIFLPAGRHKGYTPILPPVNFDLQKDHYIGGRVMVNTTGQLYEACKRGLTPISSHRINAFNSATASVCHHMGAEWSVLSPELTAPQIRDIADENKTAIIYGRLPLMTLYRCAISDGGANCKRDGEGFARGDGGTYCKSAIVDRKGVSFPIIALPDCTNIVYNSVPVYMADKKKELAAMGLSRGHFIFSTETKEECEDIIRRYKEGLSAPAGFSFTRIQS